MMSDNSEDPKNVMPTERKSMWRTADERRMSDLLRVLEWMERRHRKQKEAIQVCTVKDTWQSRFRSRLLPQGRDCTGLQREKAEFLGPEVTG